ncbi:MAG: SRPBCC domain-containing protein [Gammaproteobacteria bacterium]|nr:SRPBCC domain-containing protein [Gammaproteobacteria bacterium]
MILRRFVLLDLCGADKEIEPMQKPRASTTARKSSATNPRVIKNSKTSGYAKQIVFNAPDERVFTAITSLKGLRGWWTSLVSGKATAGGDVRCEFEGLDEYIIMHVEAAKRPATVRWTCVVHTGLPEWNGTTLWFGLVQATSKTCKLNFQHIGLTPELECFNDCKLGWDHFLASLVSYVEQGKGAPFGA